MKITCSAVNFAILSLFALHFAVVGPQNVVGQTTIIERSLELRIEIRGETIRSAIFSPDGKRILATGREHVKIWDALSGKELRTLDFRSVSGHNWFIDPGSPLIILSSGEKVGALIMYNNNPSDKFIRIWNADSGKELRTFDSLPLSRSTYFVFSPDGKKLVTASRNPADRLKDAFVRIWDGETGKELQVLRGHTDWVNFATFSPDGKKVATMEGKILRFWDADTGKELQKLEGVEFPLLFSQNGEKFLVGLRDGRNVNVQIWDANSGMELPKLKGDTSRIHTFSPDGTKVVGTPSYRTVQIWDADSGEESQKLVGHFGNINSTAFSQDATKVVTASDDTSARIWDTESGKELQRLIGHTKSVNSATFSPDGKKVVTVSRDGAARIWTLEAHPSISEAVKEPTMDLQSLPDSPPEVEQTDQSVGEPVTQPTTSRPVLRAIGREFLRQNGIRL